MLKNHILPIVYIIGFTDFFFLACILKVIDIVLSDEFSMLDDI